MVRLLRAFVKMCFYSPDGDDDFPVEGGFVYEGLFNDYGEMDFSGKIIW